MVGTLFACVMAFSFTLPVGIVQATTNLQPGLNVITELVIGYMIPGKWEASSQCCFQDLWLHQHVTSPQFSQRLQTWSLHENPPKIHVHCSVVWNYSSLNCLLLHIMDWWLLTSIDHISDEVFYNASIIWGVVGPRRMFTKEGIYLELNWFFLIGLLSPVPVWLLLRKFPEKKWLKLLHMPMIMAGGSGMPSARAVHYLSWGAVRIFFNYYIFKKYKG